MSGPSPRALDAAYATTRRIEKTTRPGPYAIAADALGAAHDPALGLDGSVCLRDVVEAFAAWPEASDSVRAAAVAHVERTFAKGK